MWSFQVLSVIMGRNQQPKSSATLKHAPGAPAHGVSAQRTVVVDSKHDPSPALLQMVQVLPLRSALLLVHLSNSHAMCSHVRHTTSIKVSGNSAVQSAVVGQGQGLCSASSSQMELQWMMHAAWKMEDRSQPRRRHAILMYACGRPHRGVLAQLIVMVVKNLACEFVLMKSQIRP